MIICFWWTLTSCINCRTLNPTSKKSVLVLIVKIKSYVNWTYVTMLSRLVFFERSLLIFRNPMQKPELQWLLLQILFRKDIIKETYFQVEKVIKVLRSNNNQELSEGIEKTAWKHKLDFANFSSKIKLLWTGKQQGAVCCCLLEFFLQNFLHNVKIKNPKLLYKVSHIHTIVLHT